MLRSRTRLLLAPLCVGLVVCTTAAATRPVTVSDGTTELVFNGGVSPLGLPGERRAPAELAFSLRVSAADGGHPAAMRRFSFETDGHVGFDFKGVDVCPYSPTQDLQTDWSSCRRAIVGAGQIEFEGAAREGAQKPTPGGGKVVVYNGPVVHGNRRLWLRYSLFDPVEATIVSPLDVKRVAGHRRRANLVLSIPKVAGDSGSLTSLALSLNRGVLATCPKGRIGFQGTGVFANGARLAGRVIQPCTTRSSG